ncbi:hypothetical protein FDP41_011395 [Naegleria fowleri]|uniref:Uncharacterized protein n=1 Tax=Naegleria fowleri TaxID=5763 RepID=A0A6A5CAS3_NAEFO|nr:uncharacterized protein FDP41_011395 [Naegleria fowleri]KAF0982465.1 hypothetical protein FDP41_011395 [Naegleria fowleri]CAG4709236.1 unnamed protein product [Naegleria fowleri]
MDAYLDREIINSPTDTVHNGSSGTVNATPKSNYIEKIVEKAVLDDSMKLLAHNDSVQLSRNELKQRTNRILLEVCPFLFSNSKEQVKERSLEKNALNVHPKFKNMYGKLTNYIQKKIFQNCSEEDIVHSIKSMMDSLMWQNEEVVDFFNDQNEWLKRNTLYNHNERVDQREDNATPLSHRDSSISNRELIWEQIKAEIFEILLGILGDASITMYEFRHALRTALYQLQLKEREYRRIPKELLEILIDQFLPNAQSGRSLVQFIISELKRLKRETEAISSKFINENIDKNEKLPQNASKRAIRVISMTIMKLLERRLIPIPGIEMIDDRASLTFTSKKYSNYRGVVDFSKKVYINYLNDTSRNHERQKKDIYITLSQDHTDLSNSTYWGNSSYQNRVIGSGSRIASSFSLSRELENWMNQYRDIIGPLRIKIPLYRHPSNKIKELEKFIKDKENDLRKRLQFIDKLEHVWDSLGSEMKTVISQHISKSLLKKLSYYQAKKKKCILENLIVKQFVGPNQQKKAYILPQNLSKEYMKLLDERIKVYLTKMEVENNALKREEFEEMLGGHKVVAYPTFLHRIGSITSDDIARFLFEKSPEYQQIELIQIRSYQFLKAFREEIGEMSLTEFQQLISSDGPLHNIPLVQSLLKKANDYIDQHESFKHISPYLNKYDKDLEAACLLFEWVFQGHDEESILKKLISCKREITEPSTISDIINDISDFILLSKIPNDAHQQVALYIPYKVNERLELVRDYCVNNILKNERNHSPYDGYKFILNYLHSLEQTLEYESHYSDPSYVSTDNHDIENLDAYFEKSRLEVVRKAAHHYIKKFICKTDEERSVFAQMIEKYDNNRMVSNSNQRIHDTKRFLREQGILQDQTKHDEDVESALKKYENYQYKYTQEEEQHILMRELELETRGKALSSTLLPNYEYHITQQRRRKLFE